MGDYWMSLSFNSQAEAIYFPVFPEKFEVSKGLNSKTYSISQLGEISTIQNKKLEEISFESFFPAAWFPGCSVPAPLKSNRIEDTKTPHFQSPSYILNKINTWRMHNQPMRLILKGSDLKIAMAVTLENFTVHEEGGAVGDIYYSMSFKEYVFYAAQRVKVVKPATSTSPAQIKKLPPPRPDTRVIPKTYTLVKGDNLWIIAKRFLGDGSKWRDLQKLNGLTDAQLKHLQIGQVIKLS